MCYIRGLSKNLTINTYNTLPAVVLKHETSLNLRTLCDPLWKKNILERSRLRWEYTI